MRAALYVRVSTEDQSKEGFSLETQEERLRVFVQAQGWTVIDPPYSDDSTGTDTERDGYQRMLRDVAKWDIAIAIKGDRFHRSTDNAMAFWRQMRRTGKQIWTIAEGRIDTPENASKWLGTMLTTAILPEFESMQNSERVLPGMEKAKERQLHVGRPPLGFIWNKQEGRFIVTRWAEKFKDDARESVEMARHNNPRPRGKHAGRILSRSAAYRLLENIKLFESGKLMPNRKRTPSGTHSKFKAA